MAGFGDIWGAVNEGTEASQQLINNYAHNQAQNALTTMYGPIAGNPEAALQLQQQNYLSQLDPKLVEAQGLANTGAGIANTTNAGMAPGRIAQATGVGQQDVAKGAVDTGLVPSAIGAGVAQNTGVANTAIPLAGANLTQQQAKATTDAIAANYAKTFQVVGGTTAFTRAASQALANDPNNKAAAWAAGQAAAQAAGFPPDSPEIRALVAEHQNGFMQDPANEIGKLNDMAASLNASTYARMTPLEASTLGKTQAEYQSERLKAVGQAQEQFGKAKTAEDEAFSKTGSIGTAAQGVRDTLSAVDQLQTLLPQLPSNGLLGAAAAHVPKSTIEQFNALAEQVHAGLAIDRMQALKAEGSGSGIRSTKEFQAAGDAYAKLDPENMTTAQLQAGLNSARAHLSLADEQAGQVMGRLNAEYPNLKAQRIQQESLYNNLLSATPGTGTLPNSSGAAPSAPANPVAPAQPPSAGATGATSPKPPAVTDLSNLSTYGRAGEPLSGPVQGFVWHHTGGSGTPEGVINTLNQRGLGVQYVMDRDGKIYRALPDGSRGAHILPSEVNNLNNGNTEGMEVIAKDDKDVTPAQVASAQQFWQSYSAAHPGVQAFGHGELNPGHKQATEGATITNAIRGGAAPTTFASDASNSVPLASRGVLGYARGSIDSSSPATASNMAPGMNTPAKQAQFAASGHPGLQEQPTSPLLAQIATPTGSGSNALASVLSNPGGPAPIQRPAAPAQPQRVSALSAAPQIGGSSGAVREGITGNETAHPAAALLAHMPEHVLAGRALLAKYLRNA